MIHLALKRWLEIVWVFLGLALGNDMADINLTLGLGMLVNLNF